MTEDGYPPVPSDGDWETLKKYANTRVMAEMFRMDGEAFGLPPDEPLERWARAEAAYERMTRVQ
jgi:hypothetical protein